jgi:DNA-binding MarR family transcriptional regulator
VGGRELLERRPQRGKAGGLLETATSALSPNLGPRQFDVLPSSGYENPVSKVSLADYRALAQFRYEIRKFLAFSESAARALGVEPQQHQALLAVKGLPEGVEPTIGALAERLCVQHHTAVALVDKLEERGWAERRRASVDRRQVLLTLTPRGSELLAKLSALHGQQLGAVGSDMVQALDLIVSTRARKGHNGRTRLRP